MHCALLEPRHKARSAPLGMRLRAAARNGRTLYTCIIYSCIYIVLDHYIYIRHASAVAVAAAIEQHERELALQLLHLA